MTPPADVLERAEALLQFRPSTFANESQMASWVERATPCLRELQAEVIALRAERDKLNLERQPFRTLMDACLERGLFASVEGATVNEVREGLQLQSTVIVQMAELATLLGFRHPPPVPLPLDLDAMMRTGRANVQATYRGGVVAFRALNLTSESHHDADQVTVQMVGYRQRPKRQGPCGVRWYGNHGGVRPPYKDLPDCELQDGHAGRHRRGDAVWGELPEPTAGNGVMY